MLTISNAHLRASISKQGAEMHELVLLETGRSIIWHGDETFWSGHSPILFPIVGSTWEGTIRHEGREFHLPKHGFVRRRQWTVVSQQADSVTLAIENQPEDLAVFPWPFRLEVTYSLHHRTLHVDFDVRNLSTSSTMWFQLGGHPSIVLPAPLRPDGQHLTQEVNPFSLVPSPAAVESKPVGYLRLEGTPHSVLRASTQGCTEPARFPIPWSNDAATSRALASNHHFNALVPLTIDTFAHEALIFDQHQITAIHVLDAQEHRIARVASSAPAWLVWAPQGKASPFICCEPWYGLPDHQGFLGNWPDRPHVQHASPGNTWHGWFNVEV